MKPLSVLLAGCIMAGCAWGQKSQPFGKEAMRDSPCIPQSVADYMHTYHPDDAIKPVCADDPERRIEPREYPAILHEVDDTPWCRVYLDDNHCRGVKRSTKKAYTCSSPDTEILEYTVSGRAFCRKVTP